MTAKELIKKLEAFPNDAEVRYAWDGGVRSAVKFVWISRDGIVVLSDGEVIYETDDRPVDAPTASKNPYWEPK